MILADADIRELCEGGMIDPYDPELIQPASLDMRLGNQWRVFTNQKTKAVDLANPLSYVDLTEPITAIEFVLHPGEFVLGGTQEIIRMPDDHAGRVEGKSSLGRLGLIVHATAGFFDPGFHGRATLEMTNLLRVPIVLHAGLPICQMSFYRMTRRPMNTYKGRYQGDREVAASRY